MTNPRLRRSRMGAGTVSGVNNLHFMAPFGEPPAPKAPVFEFVIKTWALKEWEAMERTGSYAYGRDHKVSKRQKVGEIQTTVRASTYEEAVAKVMAAREPLPTSYENEDWRLRDSMVTFTPKHEMVSMTEVS